MLQSPPFPVLPYMPQYAFYLDVAQFTDVRSSDQELTIGDWHSVLCDSAVGTWVKQRSHCSTSGMSLSPGVRSKVNCLHVCCDEMVEYEKNVWTLVRLYNGQLLPDHDPSLIFLCRPSVTSITPNVSDIGGVTANLSFFHVGMPWRYLQGGTTSSYMLIPHCIAQVIKF